MSNYLIHSNDNLNTLNNMSDTSAQKDFDRFAELATLICDTPIALISLLDTDNQWLSIKTSINITDLLNESSFCDYTVKSMHILEVEDASQDERFKNNSLVHTSPYIKFYAGYPLISPEGYVFGTLSVMDYEARKLSEKQKKAFKLLAEELSSLLAKQQQTNLIDDNPKNLAKSKEIELALHVERERFEDLVDSTDGIVWEADALSFQFTYVSQKAQRLLGFELIEWYQSGFWAEHIHPEDKSWVIDYCVASTSRSEAHDFEYRFIAKDGRVVWLRDIVNVLEEDGKPKWLRGIMVDITEQKLAEIKLKEKENYYIQILDSVQDMVFCKSYGSNIIYANQAFCNYYEKSLEELYGGNDLSFNEEEEYAQQYLKDDLEVFRTGKPLENIGEPNQRPNGEFHYFHTIKSPIFDTQGKVIQVVGVARDISESIKLKQQLQETNQMARVGGWELNLITNTLTWSAITKEIHEVSPDYVPDLQTAINFYKEGFSRDMIAQAVNEGIQSGKPWDVELQIVTAKGNEIWVKAQGTPEFLNGKCIRFYGAFQDINKHKLIEETISRKNDELAASEEELRMNLAELSNAQTLLEEKKQELEHINQELQANQAFLSNLIDNLPGYVYRVENNPDFTPIYVSEQVKTITGYTQTEYLDEQIISCGKSIYAEDAAWVWEIVQKSILKQESYECEYRILTKSNEIRWVWGRGKAVLDEQGKFLYLEGFTSDITARKQAEFALLESKKHLQHILNNLPVAIYLTDYQGYISFYNESAKELWGWEPTLFEQRWCGSQQLYTSEGKAILHEECPMALAIKNQQKLWACEAQFAKPNQERGYFLANITPFTNEKGELEGAMNVMIDITERKNAEKQLEHLIDITRNQNQRLREYTYIISHNIRSSVANLISLSELLQEDAGNLDYLKMLRASVSQLDTTIRNMNQLLDIENESQSIEKTRVNLLEVVKNNCELIQNLIRDHIELKINIPDYLSVDVIPAYLDSIINNLLTNAIKYRKPEANAWVEISAYQEENAAVLAIKDNGIGIDLEKHRNKLFKMNSRLHLKVEGKGIGLFFTKHQIEAMGGKITVESTPSVGSTFKVWFYEN